MDRLKQYRPDLVPRYEEIYARGADAPKEERARIARLVRYQGRGPRWEASECMQRGKRLEAPAAPPEEKPLQETLF